MAVSSSQLSVPIIPRNQFLLEDVPIGRGGFGTVFRGQHTKLGLVAVKTLIDNGLLPQKHLNALQKEAERLRMVCQHPCILNLHGIITEKDNYSLVLEYMPLGSAMEFRKDFTVQWPLIVQILKDVIDGMTFLHGHDPIILHLDLKADNILLDKGCRAKISDFGLSEWKTITMTVTRGEGGGQSSARKCTVTHVPPEVWSNVNLPSDKYYDIYGFGIIIWELLTGQTPYKAATEELVRSAVLSGQRPDFILIPQDCPMFLTKMMTRCWHQKPTQRPQFKELKPEIGGEFESNYRKKLVPSLKKIRQEITQKFPTTDPIYIYTKEIDSMVVPVELVEPVPSTSSSNRSTTIPKIVDETPPPKQESPPKVEKEIPKVLFKPKDDWTNEDREIRKALFSPTACRLAKTRYFTEIFKISEETRQNLIDPKKRQKFIEADETLARQVKYSKHNAFHELDGEYLTFRKAVGQEWTRITQKNFSERQRNSYYKERGYSSFSRDDNSTERGLKHQRATESLEKNPEMKRLRNGGEYYKVKKLLENPEMLKQALEDKRKGVDSSSRLVAVDSETLELVKNPLLLMMVFSNEYDIRNKYKDNYKSMFMELFANATYKGELPAGGYKLPESMKDIIPGWLEAEMTKEGFDINKLTQQQEMERRRRRYHYGMYPDDDDYDDYPSMRHLSSRMMDINMRPGMKLAEKMDGYQMRRMLSDVERNPNKTDLAKKVIRILTKPPREEREEERLKAKDKKSARQMMGDHRNRSPLEMIMMMGKDPSDLDPRILQQLMMAEQKQKKMKERKKSSSTASSSTATATKSQADLETDASASMPSSASPSQPTSQGQTNPSNPKKSKSDLETDEKGTTSDGNKKQTENKDGSVEIEHKSSGPLGAITRLFFGKNAKVPNMQVGDKNVMRIGHHFDDSDDDDDMFDSSYDKYYQPPKVARPPTKMEMDNIAENIHGDYRNLGRQLKMPYNTVEQVVTDYRKEGNHELTYQLIRKWMALNGEEATNVVLSDALHKMRRDDLSRFLRF